MEKLKEFISKFAPYLEDLRRRVYTICIIFAVFFVAGFFSAGTIIKSIINFFSLEGVTIATTAPFQFADLSINIGLLVAVIVSCPVLAYHILSFLKPALSKNEKQKIYILIPISIILFVLGFAYGFFVLYYALVVLAEINSRIGIQNIWDIGSFLSQIILTATLLGAMFQFPIIISFLVQIGLISVDFLRQKRRISFFIMFTFSTLLPPTDGLSLIVMALPLLLLYEMTILVNRRGVSVQKVV